MRHSALLRHLRCPHHLSRAELPREVSVGMTTGLNTYTHVFIYTLRLPPRLCNNWEQSLCTRDGEREPGSEGLTDITLTALMHMHVHVDVHVYL